MTLQDTPIPELEAQPAAPAGREHMERNIDQTLERLGIAELVPDFLRESILEGARRSQEEGLREHPDDNLDYILNKEAFGFMAEPNREEKAWPDFLPPRMTGPGYYARSNLHANIHFEPALLAEDSQEDIQFHMGHQAESVNAKSRVMSLGLAGSLQYVVLAESGFIPKPDIIHGASHEGMIAIAGHFGLKTLQEHEADALEAPVDEEQVLAMAEIEDEMLDLNEQWSHEFEQSQKFAVYWLHATLSKSASGLSKRYHDQRKQSILGLSYAPWRDDEVTLAHVAYGTYDTFSQSVIENYAHFHDKLIAPNADFIQNQLHIAAQRADARAQWVASRN